MTRVLIVDDDPLIRRAIQRLLPSGVKGVEAADARAALAAVETEAIDLVLLDVCLDPRAPSVPTGLELARTMRAAGMNVPVVVLSGSADPTHLREALRLDVQDYVFKSEIGLETMATLLADHVRAPLESGRVPELAGASPAAEAARRFAARAAVTRAPVLLVGETGSGREALARAIHAASDRAARALVVVRCSSTEPEVLESVLFGVQQDPPELGRVDRANGGVLYLHDVGALPQALHAKVLRLLEGGAFVRVRGRSEVTADVRVIASASPDTSPKSFGGPLGGDLYLALAALLIRVPALRDRPGDIDAIVDELAAADSNHPAFAEDARAVLRRRAWPGNVRELCNVVRAAGTFFGSTPVGATELEQILPRESGGPGGGPLDPSARAGQAEPPASGLSDLTQTILRIPDSDQRSLRAIEDTLIRQALAAAGGNKSAAARLLGVGRKFIERRVRSLGRDPT
jgi:DNA-binding NtrC family response regulator